MFFFARPSKTGRLVKCSLFLDCTTLQALWLVDHS